MRFATRLAVLILASLASGAHAGSFGVSPTRVDFDRATRSAVVEVSNDDERKLSFQVKLFEWTQDADGQDHFAESQDLIWFPQLFTVNPGDKRILRIGTKGATALPKEKSYRLFIEELPPPAEPGAGAQLRIVLRFGLPVFVAPAAPQKKLVVESVSSRPGKVLARIRNDGTQSVRFESFRLRRGADTLAEGQGWYVLAGATRVFEVPVEAAKCPSPGPLQVEGVVEGVATIQQAFDASPQLCQRP